MYKCKICGKKYTELTALYNHIESKHNEMIPKDMSVQQYYYYMKTGKMNGNCVMCKQPTGWNYNTGKYNRFCGNPKCKEEYVKIMKGRMVAKYGKTHLLNDPEKQREMLAHRSISGTYNWSDGKHESTYTGSYELDFLKTLDNFFDWDPEDISMPSPHTYTYKYEGEDRFYIPDVFIHSLDLEIEIKDGGDNPNNHHKIQEVDKEKERLKDEVMCSQKAFHYIKITNKNYENFFRFLKEIKKEFEKHEDEKKIPRIFKIEDIKGTSVKPVKESVEIIDESYLRNKKDLYVNFELFDSGQSNICLVTGLSGSGKSTLSDKLCRKYNATCIELDIFEHPDMEAGPYSQKSIYNDYFKNNSELKYKLSNNELSNSELSMEMSNALVYTLNYCSNRPNERFIIEGLQIFADINPDFVKGLPIVFVNTSMINSMLRKYKRDKYNYKVADLFEWYIADEKKFNGFKNEIIEEDFRKKADDFIIDFRDFNNVPYKERDLFFSLRFDLVKDNPEKLKEYLTKLIKASRFEEDIYYVEKMAKKANDYYTLRARRRPETKDEYEKYYDWLKCGGIDKVIKERRKDKLKLIEGYEVVEEKFEPDKFLVWFDKPIQKLKGGKIKIYHGSSVKIKGDVLNPISINVGATKYSDPRWSTYAWDNREDAMTWAVTWAIYETLGDKQVMYIGQNDNGQTLVAKPEGMTDKEFAMQLIKDTNEFYIYELEIDIKDLEIGSVPTVREYTVSKPAKILKRYDYKLNKEIIRRCINIVTQDQLDNYRKNFRCIREMPLHRGHILNNILKVGRDPYRAVIRTEIQNGNIKPGVDDISDFKYSINRHYDNNTYNYESYIIDTMKESSISIPQMSYYLQNEYEEEMRNYLNTYKKYYNLMLEEQPAAVKHINEDIRKCLIVIDGMAAKGVENNLVQFAKDDLGEIVKASKHGKPVRVYESINLVDTVNCKLVYTNSNSKQLFSLRDMDSKLIIENSFIVQRDKIGTHCSVNPYYQDNKEENILEFTVQLNNSFNLNEINDKITEGINITNLHKFDDKDYRFIKESCLRLFGEYPKEIVLERMDHEERSNKKADELFEKYKEFIGKYGSINYAGIINGDGIRRGDIHISMYTKDGKKLFAKNFDRNHYPNLHHKLDAMVSKFHNVE